jgi:hypothetical protein
MAGGFGIKGGFAEIKTVGAAEIAIGSRGLDEQRKRRQLRLGHDDDRIPR